MSESNASLKRRIEELERQNASLKAAANGSGVKGTVVATKKNIGTRQAPNWVDDESKEPKIEVRIGNSFPMKEKAAKWQLLFENIEDVVKVVARLNGKAAGTTHVEGA